MEQNLMLSKDYLTKNINQKIKSLYTLLNKADQFFPLIDLTNYKTIDEIDKRITEYLTLHIETINKYVEEIEKKKEYSDSIHKYA